MLAARRALPLCALLAVLLAGALAPAAQARTALKAIWGPEKLLDGRSAFPLYKDLGVDVLQMQVVWDRVALTRPIDARNPADPAYAWPRSVDAAYAATAAAGMKLALMVRATPPWANGGLTNNWAPTDPDDYADFLVAVARRYPRVRLWMIWGEPSRQAQFQPLPVNSPVGPRRYSILLDRAYGALKGVRRSNKVIGGMTFQVGEVRPADFVRWMRLPNGKPPRLDWFGHNPFTTRRPRLRDRPAGPGVRDLSDVDLYIKEIRRHWRPRRVKPKLFLSEYCVASDHGNTGFSFYVTRKTQARWLRLAFRIAHRQRWISGLGWFNLQDAAAADGLTCGLVDSAGRPKPAYRAFKRVR